MSISPDFIQIPKPVLQANIPASHKILYGYIYWYTKLALQTCTASNETLGKLAGLEPESVSNAISKMKNLGFLSVQYDGDPRSKKTKRTIDALVGYEKRVPLNNGTSKQGYVPFKNGTGATEILNKEEYIKRNIKDSGKKSEAKDHRGQHSPTKERIKQLLKTGGVKELAKLTGG